MLLLRSAETYTSALEIIVNNKNFSYYLRRKKLAYSTIYGGIPNEN